VLTAAAIALGATSMSDVALLRHLAPLMGSGPSGPTARRALEQAGAERALDRIARARAKARARAWELIEATPAGFPWPEVAGKTLTGWTAIDMDATLITAHSDTWQVNAGCVIAANIAADLTAWTRLLGHHDDEELRKAEPDTLRYRVWHLPARLAVHARQRTVALSPSSPAGTACADSRHPPDQHQQPGETEGGQQRASGHLND
jgi:hypothetical protein